MDDLGGIGNPALRDEASIDRAMQPFPRMTGQKTTNKGSAEMDIKALEIFIWQN